MEKNQNNQVEDLAAKAVSLAVSSGLSEAEIARALKAAAKQIAKSKVTKRDAIFKPDGTIRGVDYGKASNRRGAVLQIRLKSDAGKFQTSLLVDGKDFHEVYRNLVQLVAEHFEVSQDGELMADLLASKEKFLKAKGLATKRVEVVYDQLITK